MQGLKQMLDVVNSYVVVFKRACGMLCDHKDVFDLQIRIIQAREGMQYIRPTTKEVAGILVEDENEHFRSRDFIIQKWMEPCRGQMRFIHHTCHYTILFYVI